MNNKAMIPNLLTSMNLSFGVLSMMYTYKGEFTYAAICILLALVADGLDGRAARYFGVSGELGKEMDSLCDCVSFGAASAFLAYVYVLSNFSYLGVFALVSYSVCGMMRLARFNVNADTVHGYFMGVPIPAGGCFIATWVLFSANLNFTPASQIETFGIILPISVILLGYLLISKFKYPDFKGNGEKFSKMAYLCAFIVFIFILYLGKNAFFYALLFDIFFSYVCLGIFNYIFTLNKKIS